MSFSSAKNIDLFHQTTKKMFLGIQYSMLDLFQTFSNVSIMY